MSTLYKYIIKIYALGYSQLSFLWGIILTMVTDANQLLELLEAKGVDPLDNMIIAQSLHNGHDLCPLQTLDENSSNPTHSLILALPPVSTEADSDLSEYQPEPDTTGPAL